MAMFCALVFLAMETNFPSKKPLKVGELMSFFLRIVVVGGNWEPEGSSLYHFFSGILRPRGPVVIEYKK